MKTIEGGITAPKGYKASGVHCGLKQKNLDVALIISDVPAQAAGIFTQNKVSAAPVRRDRQIIGEKKPVRCIVTNSGNANACTGKQGEDDTKQTAELTARAAGILPEEVLVCSTGVIGVPLPMEKLAEGIIQAGERLSRSRLTARHAAEAILTTDTCIKEIAVEIEIENMPVRISGIAKGSGMIHPNMATMLAYVLTDAQIDAGLLQKLLHEAADETYHMISVDGDSSTNDTALALANGASGTPELTEGSAEYRRFKEAFIAVNKHLAQEIARDGEGATKFVEASVTGAASLEDARKLARSVITSNLVKTALFGEDANWGRILCALGYSGGNFTPEKTELRISSSAGELTLLKEGSPVSFDEKEAKNILHEHDIILRIMLHDGDAAASSWGCDLSYEYVKINGEYRT